MIGFGWSNSASFTTSKPKITFIKAANNNRVIVFCGTIRLSCLYKPEM